MVAGGDAEALVMLVLKVGALLLLVMCRCVVGA